MPNFVTQNTGQCDFREEEEQSRLGLSEHAHGGGQGISRILHAR